MPIRNILIRLTANFIYLLRRKTLRTSNARLLVFTGTSGKTLARNATAYALRKTGHKVVSPPYGYTNELGIVLAVLGIESIKLFSFSGIRRILFEKVHDETYICIELGADWYPDTDWFLEHFEPFGVCLTNISKEEWVRSLSIIWKEKYFLIKNISSQGFMCCSYYNDSIKKIKNIVPTISLYEVTVSQEKIDSFVYSIVGSKKMKYNSSFGGMFPYREAFGAALTCLYSLGVTISSEDFFSEYQPVAGRLSVIRLDSGATLIADTYKAIPQCTEYVLKLAMLMQKEKKIIILSEMRPIWKNKEYHYNQIALLLKSFTEVYFIGPQDIAKLLSAKLSNLYIIESEDKYEDLVKKITLNSNSETLFVIKGAGYYHFSDVVSLLHAN